ncbi:arsenate reductase (glutaredoxin) [Amphritea sp. HPY]|uniref:arsenate reductase (glutaredoxin) n=1 Tax=Amphritea sp. HPY TaxID=3421652 RepID=UPI003D7F0EBF
MTVEIYHNPRCSKSRTTLALLEENSVTPDVRLYLETPPTADQLKAVLAQLNMPARQLLRKGEDEYKANNLADASLTEEQIIDLMVQFPRLIERPIVISNGQARIGRPPESVLEIL